MRSLASLKEGTVVYGIHLHRDTTKVLKDHRFKDAVFYCEIEAKRRPFLIVRRCAEERGKTWFLTAPITSKGLNARDQPRKDVMRIGNLIDEKKQSYLQLFVEKVPENLISDNGGNCQVLTELDPLSFQNILKTLTQNRLGRPSS